MSQPYPLWVVSMLVGIFGGCAGIALAIVTAILDF